MDFDWVRWAAVAMCLFSLVVMWTRRDLWDSADYAFRLAASAALFLLLSTLFGLAEAALTGMAVSWRTVVSLGAVSFTVAVVLQAPRRKPKQHVRKPD